MRQNDLKTKAPALLIVSLALLSSSFAEDESGNAMFPSCKGLVDGKWTAGREARRSAPALLPQRWPWRR